MAIEFQGLDEVLDALEDIADNGKVENALGKACAVLVREAVETAPKGDGTLRRSITSKIESNGNTLDGVVYTPLEYAPYVEYGTGIHAEKGGRTDVPWRYEDEKGEWHTTYGMYPKPFMRPALVIKHDEVIEIIKEGLSND